MPDQSYTNSPSIGLTKERKVGFVLLLIFVIITIILGALKIRNTIYGPFALNHTVPGYYKDEVTTVDSLRYRDTDHDGLNDYDELYTYSTSPYLADTNSDGISDYDSVQKGIDPNCPKGQDCTNVIFSGSDIPAVATIATSSEVLGPAPSSDILGALQDPKQIRQMLINYGMKAADLDKISDADLIKLARSALYSTSTISVIDQLFSTSSINN